MVFVFYVFDKIDYFLREVQGAGWKPLSDGYRELHRVVGLGFTRAEREVSRYEESYVGWSCDGVETLTRRGCVLAIAGLPSGSDGRVRKDGTCARLPSPLSANHTRHRCSSLLAAFVYEAVTVVVLFVAAGLC